MKKFVVSLLVIIMCLFGVTTSQSVEHDYDLANQSFPNARTDLNVLFSAILSQNSKATEPSTTSAYMFWADTTTGLIKQRNSSDSAWVTLWIIADGPPSISSTDTLTNKSIDLSNNTVTGTLAELNTAISDATLVGSGITASSAETLTNKSIDFGGNTITTTIAELNTAISDGSITSGSITASSVDTLTNKTIDANGTGNAISNIDIADLSNGTDGELITWDAAGAPAVVATGTATHVLTSNGAGTAPTFQAAAGGTSTSLVATNAAGPLVKDEASSISNPTLVPNKQFATTGIGNNGNSIQFIVGAAQALNVGGTITYNNHIQGAATGSGNIRNEASSATNPTLVPHSGSSSTGIGGTSGTVSIIDTGNEVMRFMDTGITSFENILADNANGPAIQNEAASATNPTLVPNRSDLDTGIGWSAADLMHAVAGNVTSLTFSPQGIRYSYNGNITAFAGGGQSSATLIAKSVTDVTTVATTGDSIKLPDAVSGMMFIVINRGANALDVFPFSGDTIIGNSINIAVSLAVDTAITYIAVQNSIWVPLN